MFILQEMTTGPVGFKNLLSLVPGTAEIFHERIMLHTLKLSARIAILSTDFGYPTKQKATTRCLSTP
jgi:hypothetical protein